MIQDVKLEGKRKVYAIALSLALAVVMFASRYVEDIRSNPPKDISEVRVGQHIAWQETVMNCALTVYNIQSVVPPSPDDRVLIESDKICGALKCKPSSPLVKESQSYNYVCYSMREIKARL
jgi:hypothetical protein